MSDLELGLDVVKMSAIASLLAMTWHVIRRCEWRQPDSPEVSVDGLVDYVQQLAEKRYPDFEWAGITISRPGVPPIVLTVNRPEPARQAPAAF